MAEIILLLYFFFFFCFFERKTISNCINIIEKYKKPKTRERANGLNCTKKKTWQIEESEMEPGGTDDALDEYVRWKGYIL